MLNLVIHLLKNKIVSFYNIAIVASPSVGNPTHVITDALLYAMRLLRNHLPYVYDTAAYKVPNTCSYVVSTALAQSVHNQVCFCYKSSFAGIHES